MLHVEKVLKFTFSRYLKFIIRLMYILVYALQPKWVQV